jgi:hypothetical protein
MNQFKRSITKQRFVRVYKEELTLSSIVDRPKYVFSLTSFKHFAHLCIEILVKLTKKGSKIKARKPKINIARQTSRYPNRLGRYSTIDIETASQKGHFILVVLKHVLLISH